MRKSILAAVCLTVLPGFSAVAKPLRTVTHWAANTYGTPGPHIQNYLEDMRVDPDGKVWTYCGYDEGGNQFALFDRNGKVIGRDHRIYVRSDTVKTKNGVTWKIVNFYGRGFKGNIAPPPVGDSAPRIVSTQGDTLFSDSVNALRKYGDSIKNRGELPWIVDPTAISVTNDGRLMVASNGPDQNVRLVKVPLGGVPRMDTTTFIGDTGGVFVAGRNGEIPGQAGDHRFWGIRGLGMDSTGRVYVGMTGMPMQVGGGADIRSFTGFDTRAANGRVVKSSLVWKAQGLAFVNTADFDPDSNGTSLYKNAERFHMDWSQAPGKSWSLAAVTLDPFKYPQDPRLNHSLEETWVRRIGGKLFQFNSDMYGSYLIVTRFEPGSEIGIPVAWFNTGANSVSEVTALGIHPTWDPSGNNWMKRWMWVDKNKDGNFQADEFSTYSWPCFMASGFTLKENGDLVMGCNDFYTFPSNGLVDGIPGWSVATLKTTSFTDVMGRDTLWPKDVRLYSGYLTDGKEYRMAAVPKSDAMLVATGSMETYFNIVVRVDNWSVPARRKVSWATPVDFKFPTDGQIHLDVNSDTTVAPMSIAADSQYMYINYLDKAPDTTLWTYDNFWYQRKEPRKGTVRGEITVWDMLHLDAKGRPLHVGFIVPDTNVGFQAGANDLWYTMNVAVQADGTRLITAEEDGWGKVLVHKWCPDGAKCSGGTAGTIDPSFKPASRIGATVRGRDILLRNLPTGTVVSLLDARGRRVSTSATGIGATGSSEGMIPVATSVASGLYIVRIEQAGERPIHLSVPVP